MPTLSAVCGKIPINLDSFKILLSIHREIALLLYKEAKSRIGLFVPRAQKSLFASVELKNLEMGASQERQQVCRSLFKQ